MREMSSDRLLLRSAVLATVTLMWATLPSAVPLAGAALGVCPNEALRSELRSGQLPNCRAYERVTPAYKESAILTNTFAVSPEGSRIIAGSLGTFADAEQLTLSSLTSNVGGAAYLFSRTQAGWAAASLGPPASSYRSNGMLDASTDLHATLWTLEPVVERGQPNLRESNIYLERQLGTFAKVGPLTPESSGPNATSYAYRGASEDLSRVLFSAGPGFRWPFDGTVEEGGTLYEYMGVEQPGETREPTLVGVEGGRGSRTLISHCGTRLGSSSSEERARENSGFQVRGSMYNAISADGARTFFTAVGTDEAGGCEGPQASELFAREELPMVSGELPPANMRTVPISEPEAEACQACLAGGEAKDAFFQGASLDGSKVFFTTEQKLLPEAEGENLYEYDFDAPAGERVTLLSGGAADPEMQGVARISEGGSHVYFVAKGVLTNISKNGVGSSAAAGADNLYVHAEGHTSFVATLSPGDSGDWARLDRRPVLASGEGRFLVFTSVADLTGEGLKGARPQVFQYDAVTGALVRASIGQDGYNDGGREPAVGSTIVNGFPSAYSYVSADSPSAASGTQASADGAVFFSSPDALTPQALADRVDLAGQMVPNVYEYRAGHVYLLSDGRDISVVNSGPGAYLVGADPAGGDVFFFTSDSLIAGDGDTQQDLYDARVGGGYPTPVPPPSCGGEACQGGLAGAFALAPLGGSATQGEEEDAPAAPTPARAKPKPKATKVKRKHKVKGKRRARVGKRASRAMLHGRVYGRAVR